MQIEVLSSILACCIGMSAGLAAVRFREYLAFRKQRKAQELQATLDEMRGWLDRERERITWEKQ